jgi:hypothetical protein
MSATPLLPGQVIEAFHLMWGNFPENVTLVHKSRTVMAVNKAAEKMGFVKPGMNCAKIGTEPHKGCLADKAVEFGEVKYVHIPLPDSHAVGFWIPLDGYPEFFLHFNVGLTFDYKAGAPRDMAEAMQAAKKGQEASTK